jgi:hypothetical protein
MAVDSFLIKAQQTTSLQIQCSLSDHLAVPAPISVVFFYRQAIPKERIVEALQNVLVDFPLFAGRLVKTAEGLSIDCQNQGVRMSVVHCASLPDNMAQFVDPIKPFKSLTHQAPVLHIQLNYCQDGMAIGYCWHHSLGDMATFMEFLKALSASAQGKSYPPPHMVTDRMRCLEHMPLCKKEKSLRLKILGVMDVCRLMKHVYSKRECVYLHFTEEEIGALRQQLSERTGLPLSRNDALCAHLLELTTHYRRDPGVYLSLAVNMRSRLKLPPNLLGNFSDLVSIPIEKPRAIETTAKAVHGAIHNYLNDYFQHPQILQEWVDAHDALGKLRRLIPESLLPELNHLIVTNWTHFDVYSIDFGIVSPYLFLPIGRSPLPWAACIVEGCDNQGLLVTLIVPATVAKKIKKVNTPSAKAEGFSHEHLSPLRGTDY